MSERPQNKHLRPFKKGQSGNPGGKRKVPDDLKDVKPLTKEIIARTVAKYGAMSLEELLVISKNPKTPGIELAFVNSILKAIKQGDVFTLDKALDRAIGKVTDKLEISPPKPFILEKLNGDRLIMGVEDQELIED